MPSYTPGLDYIVAKIDALLLKLRLGDETTDAANIVVSVGSPEGQIVGSPGDVSIAIPGEIGASVGLWQKQTGELDEFGWVEISGGGGGGGASPNDAFITFAANADLPNERVLTAGTNISLDLATPGQVIINATGGGASPNDSFITFAANADLPNERVLTAGTNVTLDLATPGQVIINATGGAVTLQDAIDGQGVAPTTQSSSTTVGLDGGASWFFTNNAGATLVAISDDQPIGIQLVARDTLAGAGQQISVTGGAASVAASAGGPLVFTGGAGNTSGPGGAVSLTTGAGGSIGVSGDLTLTTGPTTDANTGSITLSTASATGTNRSAGDIAITGGNSTGTAEGADINVTCGGGGATGGGGDLIFSGGAGGSTSGPGGDATLRGGAPTDGAGGSVIITGRDAATTTAANRAGGSVTIDAGDSTGTTAGASVTITAGSNTVNGAGGALFLFAGDGGPSGTSPGGNASLVAGSSSTVNGAGGDAAISGGTGSGTARGGDVNKTPGLTGTGRPGMEISLGAVAMSLVISPAVLAAGVTQNYSPPNFHRCNVVRITPNAAGSDLGGLENLAGQDGREIRFFNIGTVVGQVLTLIHEDAGSIAANRFSLPGAANLTVGFGVGVIVWYDGTSDRWRVLSTT